MLLNIFQQPPLQPYLTGRLAPGATLDSESDEQLLAYIREEASTTYHPTSTCAIGRVVDENLHVFGVQGLAVVDASVMPAVVSGNTNAATIMIAEKAAAMWLKSDRPN